MVFLLSGVAAIVVIGFGAAIFAIRHMRDDHLP